jgi:hypothetical protein
MTHITALLYFMLGLFAGLVLEGLIEDECTKPTVTSSAYSSSLDGSLPLTHTVEY